MKKAKLDGAAQLLQMMNFSRVKHTVVSAIFQNFSLNVSLMHSFFIPFHIQRKIQRKTNLHSCMKRGLCQFSIDNLKVMLYRLLEIFMIFNFSITTAQKSRFSYRTLSSLYYELTTVVDQS